MGVDARRSIVVRRLTVLRCFFFLSFSLLLSNPIQPPPPDSPQIGSDINAVARRSNAMSIGGSQCGAQSVKDDADVLMLMLHVQFSHLDGDVHSCIPAKRAL